MALVTWHIDRVCDGVRLRAGFTTRAGGTSDGPYASLNLGPHVGDDFEAVRENRELLARELGVEPAWMEQVHGARIAKADKAGTYAQTDGLWLDETCLRPCADGLRRAAACVMVADCVPLLLVGRERAVAAAVHAGRAGMMAAIAPKAARVLNGEVDALVGPAICGRCYEVPEAMRGQARAQVAQAACTTRWGTPSIDVPGAVAAQLGDLGPTAVRLHETRTCTFENREYFSHRRATAKGMPTGRFAGVVLLEAVA